MIRQRGNRFWIEDGGDKPHRLPDRATLVLKRKDDRSYIVRWDRAVPPTFLVYRITDTGGGTVLHFKLSYYDKVTRWWVYVEE
jgi:hypothetical protein